MKKILYIIFALAISLHLTARDVKQIGTSRSDYVFCVPPSWFGTGEYDLSPPAWEGNILDGSLGFDSRGRPILGCLNPLTMEPKNHFKRWPIHGKAFQSKVLPCHENLAWLGECLSERTACTILADYYQDFPTNSPYQSLTSFSTFSGLYSELFNLTNSYIKGGNIASNAYITYSSYLDFNEDKELLEEMGVDMSPPDFSSASNSVFRGKIVSGRDFDNLVESINSFMSGALLSYISPEYYGYRYISQEGSKFTGNYMDYSTPPHYRKTGGHAFEYTYNIESNVANKVLVDFGYSYELEARYTEAWARVPYGDSENGVWTKGKFDDGVGVSYTERTTYREANHDGVVECGNFQVAYTNEQRLSSVDCYAAVHVSYYIADTAELGVKTEHSSDFVVFVPIPLSPDTNEATEEGSIKFTCSKSNMDIINSAKSAVLNVETIGYYRSNEQVKMSPKEGLLTKSPEGLFGGDDISFLNMVLNTAKTNVRIQSDILAYYTIFNVEFKTGGYR